jgi:hypothetical protein
MTSEEEPDRLIALSEEIRETATVLLALIDKYQLSEEVSLSVSDMIFNFSEVIHLAVSQRAEYKKQIEECVILLNQVTDQLEVLTTKNKQLQQFVDVVKKFPQFNC